MSEGKEKHLKTYEICFYLTVGALMVAFIIWGLIAPSTIGSPGINAYANDVLVRFYRLVDYVVVFLLGFLASILPVSYDLEKITEKRASREKRDEEGEKN